MGKTDWGSSDIILSHPGLTFERFIELGGRERDLRWDINPLRNWTIVKKGDAPPVQSTEVPVEEVPDVECTMCGETKPHDKRWDSSTAGAEDRHLCSEKCWSEFMDWGVWQKDLGNGITNEFNGPSPRGGIYRSTPVAEGPLVDDKTRGKDTIPGQ